MNLGSQFRSWGNMLTSSLVVCGGGGIETIDIAQSFESPKRDCRLIWRRSSDAAAVIGSQSARNSLPIRRVQGDFTLMRQLRIKGQLYRVPLGKVVKNAANHFSNCIHNITWPRKDNSACLCKVASTIAISDLSPISSFNRLSCNF